MIDLLSQTPAAPAPVKAPAAKPQAASEAAPTGRESASFSDALNKETQQSAPKETSGASKEEAEIPDSQLAEGAEISSPLTSDLLFDAPLEAIDGKTGETPANDNFAALTSLEAQPPAADDTPKAQRIAAASSSARLIADGEIDTPRIAAEQVIETKDAPAAVVETPTIDQDVPINAAPQPGVEAVLATAATPQAAPINVAATTAAKPAAKLELGSLKDGTPLKSGEPMMLKDAGGQPSQPVAEAEDGADFGSELARKMTEQAADSAPNSPKTSATKASFEQLLTAQTEPQPMESASSALAAKAVPTDAVAAKPVPEVLVQVPQQRADMAAKQVGIELARQVKNGDTQFVVRMDPPELGKLDVRMTVTKAGEVQATIVVEREATLDLLSRDAKALERSLADAGLKVDQNALNFSLKQNHSDGFEGQLASGSGNAEDGELGDDDITETLDSAAIAQMQISSGRPLDVIA